MIVDDVADVVDSADVVDAADTDEGVGGWVDGWWGLTPSPTLVP